MKIWRLGFCIALACATLIAAPARSQSSKAEEVREIERLEKLWNEAQLKSDADTLAALWADDLEVAVPRMPVMNKTEVLNVARSGHVKFTRYETSEVKVRVYGDSAVVTGALERDRMMDTRQIADHWRFTKVYELEADGKWRVVAFHASEAAWTG
jgi:uncharacterized protein (TIGR02246 family)